MRIKTKDLDKLTGKALDKRSEKTIQRDIVRLLKMFSIPHSVTDVSKVRDKYGVVRFARGQQGWPDITAVLPDGKLWGIEVKAAKGRLSPIQIVLHSWLKAHNAVVMTARSASDVEEFLTEYRKTKGYENAV